MANTTFNGPVRSQNGFQTVSISSTTGAVTTTATLGPSTTVDDVTATNVTVTTLEFTGAAATASNAAAFSATRILTVKADGTTYYIPAATATW